MKQKVPRINDIDLAGYIENRLDDNARAEVARSLEDSSEYRIRVNIISQVFGNSEDPLSAGAPAEYLIDRAVHLYRPRHDAIDIVLALAGNALKVVRTSPGITLLSAPQVPAFRKTGVSGPTLAVISKTFDAISADLVIEHVADNRCSIILTVAGRETGKVPPRLRAELSSANREYASCLIHDGLASFEDLKPGRYDITITQCGFVRGIFGIRIDS